MVGRTLSHYAILEKLGEGGMGVVYKARDTRLNRFVALKVLPPEKVRDPERKRRFVQEAQAASALNHPNIITIHDVASHDGTDYIVMEYVQGKTLDHLIQRKGLRPANVLRYGVAVADGLAKAHSAGIVHRDLKPSNIMVSDDGRVKLLDFGLAKLTETAPAGDNAETGTIRAETEEGAVMGTPAYMSPEQASGKSADARSDIFSFGSVLYEMATGTPPFQGPTRIDTMAAILHNDPKPPTESAEALPRDLERVILRCLRKDPGRRFQNALDLKLALDDLKEDADTGRTAPLAAIPQRRPVWVWIAAGLAFVLAAVVAWTPLARSRPPPAALSAVPLTTYPGTETEPTFSPDGNQVAFSWNGAKQDNYDIYVKLVGPGEPLRLTTSPADDRSPAWSPDGRWIAFTRSQATTGALMAIPALGGPERKIADVFGQSVSWSPDGRWLAANVERGLALINFASGEVAPLADGAFSPAFSPQGTALALSRVQAISAGELHLLPLAAGFRAAGPMTLATKDKSGPRDAAWTPDGRWLIYSSVRAGPRMLWRVDASGGAEPAQLAFAGDGVDTPAISHQGNRLAYTRDLRDINIWQLDLTDPVTAAGAPVEIGSSSRNEHCVDLSPDGKRIVFESNRSGFDEVWVADADGRNAVQLTSFSGPHAGGPAWSPDGTQIAFDASPEGTTRIYLISATGGAPRRLTDIPSSIPVWSRDGKAIYFRNAVTNEVWKIPTAGGQAIQITKTRRIALKESVDGAFVYTVQERLSDAPIWRMPAGGGEEIKIIPAARGTDYEVVKDGIYFIASAAGGGAEIRFHRFSDKSTKTISAVKNGYVGFSVARDRSRILFTQIDRDGKDLMLVENFR